jgi:glutamine amidotransferase
MQARIFIPDFGMGNLHTVRKSLNRLNLNPVISADPAEIEKADKVILPGVGHFQTAMENLRSLDMIDVLSEFALVKKKPVLGICLGMQLMARVSEEGNAKGLGWLDADVVKFRIKDTLHYKVPHIGWQPITMTDNLLFKGLSDKDEFYFIHAYHFDNVSPDYITGKTSYESEFVSAVVKENIFGVQFHPEKSHHSGAVVIKNFIDC